VHKNVPEQREREGGREREIIHTEREKRRERGRGRKGEREREREGGRGRDGGKERERVEKARTHEYTTSSLGR